MLKQGCTAVRMGILYGFDFVTDDGFETAVLRHKHLGPEYVWIPRPCDPFCTWHYSHTAMCRRTCPVEGSCSAACIFTSRRAIRPEAGRKCPTRRTFCTNSKTSSSGPMSPVAVSIVATPRPCSRSTRSGPCCQTTSISTGT